MRIRNPGNLLKSRGGKRGRPKKSAIRPSLLPPKPPPIPDEEQEELKVNLTSFRSNRITIVLLMLTFRYFL